jgi:hypothetical protein
MHQNLLPHILRQAGESATRTWGYILESPGERGRYCALARGLSSLEKLLEQKETAGAGGRCDLFWWGNMAAETDCQSAEQLI